MRYRNIGPLRCSEIGFGGAALSGNAGGYNLGSIDDEAAMDVLSAAIASGINLIDTAPVYGLGESERRIGHFLQQNIIQREDIVLASKFGITWDDKDTIYIDNSPDTIRAMLDRSLNYLQTDYLDIYLLHWRDDKVPLEDTLSTLNDLQSQGLIKHIGICNYDLAGLKEARQYANIDVVQTVFNLLNLFARNSLFDFCRHHDIGFMAYSPLGQGLLTQSLVDQRELEATDYRASSEYFQAIKASKQLLIDKFLGIAKDLDNPAASVALRWVLSHAAVSTALCGIKSRDHLKALLHSPEPLSGQVTHTLDQLANQYADKA